MRAHVLAVSALMSLAAGSALAAPCAGFLDVDDSSPFCVNVEWMKNRGITLGLTATQYAPNDPVTRLQMAAFMYRLGYQNAFLQGGSAFGATAVLGTTDAEALELLADGARVMRYEPTDGGPNVIGGDPTNVVTAGVEGATISGGGNENFPNRVTDDFGTVSGGASNQAGDGAGNTQNSTGATVGGGADNLASGLLSTVSGGGGNQASGSASTVVGGSNNQATGTASTVIGGASNVVDGDRSVAAGGNATVVHSSTFLWNGWSGNGAATSVLPNAVELRGENGLVIDYGTRRADGGGTQWIHVGPTPGRAINTSTGGYLSTGGAWVDNSDVASKSDFRPIDIGDVLERVATLPITSWRYVAEEDGIRHLGPMAQDFRAAFGLGQNDKSISALDSSGVALAAIQGVNAKLEAEGSGHRRKLAELRAQVDALSIRIEQLLATTGLR